MSTPTLADALATALRDAEAAHLAYEQEHGPEPEWPQWYAHHLVRTFGDTYEYEDLLAALIAAATAHGVHEATVLGGKRDEQWPEWYAAHMADTLSGARQRFAAQLEALDDL
jgi:hypothetical protein